ncbi:hypothetical protein B0H19DRAFT_1058949 [Mycena capillaripes]|nr:hypothetical protein B0H19DRAFT_1058949 [Mycena capillaripes]
MFANMRVLCKIGLPGMAEKHIVILDLLLVAMMSKIKHLKRKVSLESLADDSSQQLRRKKPGVLILKKPPFSSQTTMCAKSRTQSCPWEGIQQILLQTSKAEKQQALKQSRAEHDMILSESGSDLDPSEVEDSIALTSKPAADAELGQLVCNGAESDLDSSDSESVNFCTKPRSSLDPVPEDDHPTSSPAIVDINPEAGGSCKRFQTKDTEL